MAEPAKITFLDPAGATQTLSFDVVTDSNHNLALTVTDSPVEKGADLTDHAFPSLDRVVLSIFISNQPIYTNADPSGSIEEITEEIPKYQAPSLLDPSSIDSVGDVASAVSPGGVTKAVSGAIKDGINKLLSGGGTQRFSVVRFSDGLNRPREFYEAFRFLRDTVTLLRVLTSLRDYDNMVIEDMTGLRDASTGDGATFAVSFREVKIANTQLGAVDIDPSELRAFKNQNTGSKATKNASGQGQNKSILASATDSLTG